MSVGASFLPVDAERSFTLDIIQPGRIEYLEWFVGQIIVVTCHEDDSGGLTRTFEGYIPRDSSRDALILPLLDQGDCLEIPEKRALASNISHPKYGAGKLILSHYRTLLS